MAGLMARSLRAPISAAIAPRNLGIQSHSQCVRHFSQLLLQAKRSHRNTSAFTPSRIAVLSHRTLFTRKEPRPFRRVVVWTLLAFGATFGVAYHLDSRSAIHRWIAIPVLQAVTDPETAQKLAVKLLSLGIMPRDMVEDDATLAAEVAGLQLSNPIGLAAGFDKQAEAIDGLLSLGFGIVEIGSVTPEPQPGNEKPRYFRLVADRAAINRYGFNSEGHDVILGRLKHRVQEWILGSSHLAKSRIAVPDSTSDTAQLLREADINTVLASDHVPKSLRSGQLLAVNLGKNKTSPEDSVEDYVKGVQKLGEYADFIVINISSPNTPGLRGLQRKQHLHGLMAKVVDARKTLSSKVPILVKISPDLTKTELHDIADAAVSSGIEGLIVSNTTTSRPSSLLSKSELTNEKGGLSGVPLKPLALEAVQTVRRRVGDKISIIGCGGIFSGEDALDFAKAGADAIELYTSFGYEGVGHPRRVKDELVALLKSQGKTWKDSVGSGLDKRDFLGKLPSGEKESSTLGGLNERFGVAVADIKGQLEDLRRSVGLATNRITSGSAEEQKTKDTLQKSTSPTARPIFHPDSSDEEYTSLIEKVNEVLGIKETGIKKEKMMETELTQAEALRVKLGIALQDPVVPPSVAMQGLGEQATVAGGEPSSGRIEQPPSSLKLIDGRGASVSSGRSAEAQALLRREAEFRAADRARVV